MDDPTQTLTNTVVNELKILIIKKLYLLKNLPLKNIAIHISIYLAIIVITIILYLPYRRFIFFCVLLQNLYF